MRRVYQPAENGGDPSGEAVRMDDDVDPFRDARASAIVAKRVAREVLAHLEDARAGGPRLDVGLVEAVSAVFPQHPLDTAVHDLAIATLASSRAADAAGHATVAEYARLAGEAARLAAQTLSFAEQVAASPQLRAAPAQRARVAHAAALTAFAAAELAGSERPAGAQQQVPAFPQSWRRLIDLLSQAIDGSRADAEGEEQHLVRAAAAARDGAEAARHAYDSLERASTAHPAVVHFVRVAALASAYAGCAALVPLLADEARPAHERGAAL
jgi:hypothetical protein